MIRQSTSPTIPTIIIIIDLRYCINIEYVLDMTGMMTLVYQTSIPCSQVLDSEEFKRRTKEYDRLKYHHYYFMALKSDAIIDATEKGNASRFINHSCDPNSETQKVG